MCFNLSPKMVVKYLQDHQERSQKIKFYMSVRGELTEKDQFDAITSDLQGKIDEIKQDLKEFTS